MSRINPTVRGFLIIIAIAVVITLLNLQIALNSLLLIAQIAFFLAIAFFLFLVWRERRGDLEGWSEWNRRVFYAAIVLIVLDIGMLIGLSPSGPDALAFFLVLGACAWTLVRIWRAEHQV